MQRYGSSQGTPKMILMYQEWNTLTVESQYFSPPTQNFQGNRKTYVNSFCLVSAQMTRAHIRQRSLLDIIRPPGIFQWRVHTYNCAVYEHFYTHWHVLEALHLNIHSPECMSTPQGSVLVWFPGLPLTGREGGASSLHWKGVVGTKLDLYSTDCSQSEVQEHSPYWRTGTAPHVPIPVYVSHHLWLNLKGFPSMFAYNKWSKWWALGARL